MRIIHLVASSVVMICFALQAIASAAIGDFARNSYGSLRLMYYDEAAQYCASLGTRLPTAREYAELSTSMGAAGIIDTQYPDFEINHPKVRYEVVENIHKHFYPLYRVNEAGELAIYFYYNPYGYRIQNDFGNVYLWTSSLQPNPNDLPEAYAFQIKAGGFGLGASLGSYKAVRCVLAEKAHGN